MRRVRLAAAGLLTVVLAGCGVAGGDSSGGQGGSGGSSAASSSGSGQTRTIHHAMGDTEVAAHPKRVVVLDTGVLDDVVSLGVDPVGSVHAKVTDGLPKYLRHDVHGTKIVGTILEPNLEAIASLHPDLILSNAVRSKDIYDQLSGIAPTVLAKDIGVTWKHNFKLFAKALGKLDKAKRMLADYEQRAHKLGAKIGDPDDVQVSVVRFIPGEIRLYQKHSYIGSILSEVGLSRPPSQRSQEKLRKAISPERINKADGDVIFVTTYGPKKKTAINSVTSGKLWDRLNAVQHGDVHVVPDTYWMVGLGISSAEKVLDDLDKYLTD